MREYRFVGVHNGTLLVRVFNIIFLNFSFLISTNFANINAHFMFHINSYRKGAHELLEGNRKFILRFLKQSLKCQIRLIEVNFFHLFRIFEVRIL